jgi:hypothetical protein
MTGRPTRRNCLEFSYRQSGTERQFPAPYGTEEFSQDASFVCARAGSTAAGRPQGVSALSP